MINQQGFTLIETLVALSISIILLTIGFSIQTSVLEKHETDKFFELFQSDLLYLQQRTVTKQEYVYMTISPSNHTYTIRQGGFGTIIKRRQIPEDWEVTLQTLSMPISFNYSGTLRNPGMFTIKTKSNRYSVYFPLGKGRCYIVEEKL